MISGGSEGSDERRDGIDAHAHAIHGRQAGRQASGARRLKAEHCGAVTV